MAPHPNIGDRLSYDGALCTVRYAGEVAGTSGAWLGVEWDDPARGKHDGSHKGVRYFSCLARDSATAASFVRPTRPAEPPCGFVAALTDKYTAELNTGRTIQFSGKVAEEVGFEKTRRQQADLSELRFAILDGARITDIGHQDQDQDQDQNQGAKPVREICPRVRELDLSRNLFTHIGQVVGICAELPELHSLRLNGNRFQDVLGDQILLTEGAKALAKVESLTLEETLLSWEEICHVATYFPSLRTLSASTNQFSRLPEPSAAPALHTLEHSLTSLNLEFNDFTNLADVACLSGFKALRNLHLKGNNIVTLLAPEKNDDAEGGDSVSPAAKGAGTAAPPASRVVFSPTLQYLDVSYNRVDSWAFVDALPAAFPGLTSLRFAHNPIYDDPDLDGGAGAGTGTSVGAAPKAAAAAGARTTEEAYMLTVGRLACLKMLNFGAVSRDDRQNAEMFYLARIGRHLSAADAGPEAEARVLARHARYRELCALYGPPAVSRARELNPAFLEARLVTVRLVFAGRRERGAAAPEPAGRANASGGDAAGAVEHTVRIPKSFDIYAVKGIAGKLFGLAPLGLRLIWETGEWDPVAGFDDEVADDSSDEEDMDGMDAAAAAAAAAVQESGAVPSTTGDESGKAGKWVKREVELPDGPRLLGFCVDGLDVTVRVEPR